ncbi:MAG: D-alanyl-D-alanine carboxypeptidase [Actinomycetes bacterium]
MRTVPLVTPAVATAAAAAVLAVATWLPATTAVASSDPLNRSGVVVDGRQPPKVRAASWIVVDADTGEVLAAKNGHGQLRPASTLKTLTAITLLPRLDLHAEYRVRWEDANTVGSAVGIVPGSHYTIDQLFYGLLLPSGNDAAEALASAAGGKRATVRAMNEHAVDLGAVDTVARNVTGLDAKGQVSSAFDMAIFARAGLQDRDFRRYVSTVSTTFPAQEPKRDKRRATYMIYNQNPLLLDGYRGILGVKTGYTTLAGRTFVAAVKRGGRTLIVALMGLVDPTDVSAERLFTWGFAHADKVTPVGSLEAGIEEPKHPSSVATTAAPQAAGLSADAFDSHGTFGAVTALGVTGALGLLIGGVWLRRRRT